MMDRYLKKRPRLTSDQVKAWSGNSVNSVNNVMMIKYPPGGQAQTQTVN